MGFYSALLGEVQKYLQDNPYVPAELAMANLVNKKMRAFKIRYDQETIQNAFCEGKNVGASQIFYKHDEIAKNTKRIEKYYKNIISSMIRLSKYPTAGSNPAIDDAHIDISHPQMNEMIMHFLKPGNSADTERYNNRILNIWNNGTIEERAGLVNECLEEIDRIDISKWDNKGIDYIVDHFDDYMREISIAKCSRTFYVNALYDGYIERDPEKMERYRNLENQADDDFIRVDNSIRFKTQPIGAFVNVSNLESPVEQKQSAEADKISSYKSADSCIYTDMMRIHYYRFVSTCEAKKIKLPKSSVEYLERFDKDFKDFKPELNAAFYETIKFQENMPNKTFPWESREYKRNKMVLDNISGDELAEFNSIEAFNKYVREYNKFKKDINLNYGILDGVDEEENDSNEISDINYTGRYKELIDSIKIYLGYEPNEEMSLILGGENKAELINNADDFKKYSNTKSNETVYAMDKKSGKPVAFKLDYSQWNGLSTEEGAIKEVSKEDLKIILKNQVASFERKLKKLEGYQAILSRLGESSSELRETLGLLTKHASANKPVEDLDLTGINYKLNDLAYQADVLRENLLEKSRKGLLSDNEGKALLLCENLEELATGSIMGVPYDEASDDELEEKEPDSVVPELGEVIESTNRLCESFDSTCTGFRNDSAEFKYLHESVKILREQLKCAADNEIKINQDALREEYSRVFTAAKKYMEHRTGMATKNGRTQTRLSFAKEIVAMGESLGCKPLTDKELLAHTLTDKLVSTYLDKIKKNPDDTEAEEDYVRKCLANRKEFNSRIFNDRHFNTVVSGMKKDAMLKSIYTEYGRDDFVSKAKAAREKYQKEEGARANQNPNKAASIKETDIYKKTERDLQLAINRYSKYSRVAKGDAIGTVGVYFNLKLMQKKLTEIGENPALSDKQAENVLNRFSDYYTGPICDAFNKTKIGEKLKEELNKMDGKVKMSQFDSIFPAFEKEMSGKADSIIETYKQEQIDMVNRSIKANDAIEEDDIIDTNSNKIEEEPKVFYNNDGPNM